MMKILVSNDDGINSNGIFDLVTELKDIADVFVAAPNRQKSACSHSLTINQPLRASEFYKNGEFFGYAINGTPADCVKLALCSLMPELPDMVISGINHGSNTSVNILYSGTCAGATEGMLRGIPSIAISLNSYLENADCKAAAKYGKIITEKFIHTKIPNGTFLNVNVPDKSFDEIKGIKATKVSSSEWIDKYDKRKDPFNREYFWFAGEYISSDFEKDTDESAMNEDYVSVTPVRFELTDKDYLNELNKIFL